MSYILGDVPWLDGVHFGQVAIQDDASRKKETRGIFNAALRIGAVAHEVSESLAAFEPIAIEARDRQNVGDIHLTYKCLGRLGHLQQEIDAFQVHGCVRFVGVERGGHASDEKRLQMRILAAEHRVNPDKLLLELECLQVMRNGHEVGFRREMIGGVPPITCAKKTQLLARNQGTDAVLNTFEILRARLGPVGDRLRQL